MPNRSARAVVAGAVLVLAIAAAVAIAAARALAEVDPSPVVWVELAAAVGVLVAAWLLVVGQAVELVERFRLALVDPAELERRLVADRDRRRAERVARRELGRLLAEYEALPRVPVSDEVAAHAVSAQVAEQLQHAADVGARLSAAAPRPIEVVTPAELERRLAAGPTDVAVAAAQGALALVPGADVVELDARRPA